MNIYTPSLVKYPTRINRSRVESRQLGNYPIVRTIAALGTIAGNCSSAAFNPLLNTFMTSNNGVPVLHEFNVDGTHRRQITLSGYIDVEGVAWIEGTRYALSEETNTGVTNTITEVDIPQTGAVTITKGGANWVRTLLLSNITSPSNGGVECVAYDRKRNRFLCCTELANAGVHNVWYTERTSGAGTQLFSVVGAAGDFSDMHYDEREDVIYLLSHVSLRILKYSYTGQLLASVVSPAGHAQPEGLTFTQDMRMMIVTGEAATYTRHINRL